MNPRVLVRPARPDEFDALGALTADAYVSAGQLDPVTDLPYLSVLRDVAARAAQAEVLAAVDPDGILLGGVTFVAGPGGPYADLARSGEAEFRALAVSAAVRGRGVGDALVRACVVRARAVEGCARLVLSTQSTMATAQRLYERLGFARLPDRDWMPVPHVTLLAYALELPPTARE